jgi:hypothetical protein
MFIAHQNVAKVISMGISDFPKRVVFVEAATAKESPIEQWQVVNGTVLSVGFVIPNTGFHRIVAFNKRNEKCGEAEITVVQAPPEIRHVPSGRRRRTINFR